MSKRKPLKALIMAGGTGGHVYPALATAEVLRERGMVVEWLGTNRGIEARVAPSHGYKLHALMTRGLRGKGLASRALGLLSLLVAVLQSAWILLSYRPQVVIGFGGYAAGPAGLVASLLRIPLVIHEQNAVAGTTNRLLAKRARRVLAGFEGAFADGLQVAVTGNPLRADIATVVASASDGLNFSSERPLRLLILGGSQGALALNQLCPAAIGALSDEDRAVVHVIHQCGDRHIDATEMAWSETDIAQLEIRPFIDDMASTYAWADLAICRAGALTVSELAVTATPAFLIPLPNAIDNHQLRNAQALEAAGGARVIEQASLTAESLAEQLLDLIRHPALLSAMSTAARAWSKPRATDRVAELVMEAV